MENKLKRIPDKELDLLLNHAVKVTNPMPLDEVMRFARAVADTQIIRDEGYYDEVIPEMLAEERARIIKVLNSMGRIQLDEMLTSKDFESLFD